MRWDEYRRRKERIDAKYLAKYKDGLRQAFGLKHQGSGRVHAAGVLVKTGKNHPGTDIPEHRLAIPPGHIPPELEYSTDITPEISPRGVTRSRTVQTEQGPVEVEEKVRADALTSNVQIHPDTEFIFNKDTGIHVTPKKGASREEKLAKLDETIEDFEAQIRALDPNDPKWEMDAIKRIGITPRPGEMGTEEGSILEVLPSLQARKRDAPPRTHIQRIGDDAKMQFTRVKNDLEVQVRGLKGARKDVENVESDILVAVRPGKELSKAKTIRATAPSRMTMPWGIEYTFPGRYEVDLAPHEAEFYGGKKGSGDPLKWWDWFGGATKGEMVEAVMVDGYRVAGNISDAERLYNFVTLRINPGAAFLGLGTTAYDYYQGVEGHSADDPLRKRHMARMYDPKEVSPYGFANFGRFVGQAIPALFRGKTWIDSGLALSGSELNEGWRGDYPVGDIEWLKRYKRFGFDPFIFDTTGMSKSDLTAWQVTCKGVADFGPGLWNILSGTLQLGFHGAYSMFTPEHTYEKLPRATKIVGEMGGAIPQIATGLIADPKVIVAEDSAGAALVFTGMIAPVAPLIRNTRFWKDAAFRRSYTDSVKELRKLEGELGAEARIKEAAEYYQAAETSAKTTEYVAQTSHLLEVVKRDKRYPSLSAKINKKKKQIEKLNVQVMKTKGPASGRAEATKSRRERILREKLEVSEGHPLFKETHVLDPRTGEWVVSRESQKVVQKNLADIIPEGRTLHHETSLGGAKGVLRSVENGKAGLKEDVYVSDSLDLALGQKGKGYVLEFDSAMVNGRKARAKPGAEVVEATGGGAEFIIDKTVPGNVLSITAPNAKGVAALRRVKGIESRFDFEAAQVTERGIRIPRKKSRLRAEPEPGVVKRPRQLLNRKARRRLKKAQADLKSLLNETSPNKNASLYKLREKAHKAIEKEGRPPHDAGVDPAVAAEARLGRATESLKAAEAEMAAVESAAVELGFNIASRESIGTAYKGKPIGRRHTIADSRLSQARVEVEAATKTMSEVAASTVEGAPRAQVGPRVGATLPYPEGAPVRYKEGKYASSVVEGPLTPAAKGTQRWGTEIKFTEPPPMQPGWVKGVNALGREIWTRDTLRLDIEAWRFTRNPLDIPRQPLEGAYRFMLGTEPTSMVRWLRNPPEVFMSFGKKFIENRWIEGAKQKGYLEFADKIYTAMPDFLISFSKIYPAGSWLAPFEVSRLVYNRLLGQRDGMGWFKRFTRSPEKVIPAAIDGIGREHQITNNRWDLDAHAALRAIPDKTITYRGKEYKLQQRIGESLHTENANSSFTMNELNMFHQLEAGLIKRGSKAERTQVLSIVDKLKKRLEGTRDHRIDGYRWVESSKRGGRGQWEIDSDVGRFLKFLESKGNRHAKERLQDLTHRQGLLNEWAKPLSQQIAGTVSAAKRLGIVDNPGQALQWWMPEMYKRDAVLVEWLKERFGVESPTNRRQMRALHKKIEKDFNELGRVQTSTGRSLHNELRQANVPYEVRVKKYKMIQNINKEMFGGVRALQEAVSYAEYFNNLAKSKGVEIMRPGSKLWSKPRVFVRETLPSHWTKAQRANWAQFPNEPLFRYKVGTKKVMKKPKDLADWNAIKKNGKITHWERDVFKESKARKYHDATGLHVPKVFMYDVLLNQHIREAAATMLAGYTRFMKGNFTIRHPAVHLRNAGYNALIFSVFADINPLNPMRWKLFEQMVRDTGSQNKSLFYQIAFEEGVWNSNVAKVDGLVQAQGKAMRGFFGSSKDLINNTLEMLLPMNQNMRARVFGLGKATKWEAFKILFNEIPGTLYMYGDAGFKHTAGLRGLEVKGFYKINPATKKPGLFNPKTGKFIKDIKEFRNTPKEFQDAVRGSFRKGIEDFLNYLKQPMASTMLSTPTKIPWTNMKGEMGVMPGSRGWGVMSISQFPAFFMKAVPRTKDMLLEHPFKAAAINQGVKSLTSAFAEGHGVTDGQLQSIMDIQSRYNSLLTTVPLDLSIDGDALERQQRPSLEPGIEIPGGVIPPPERMYGLKSRPVTGPAKYEFFVPHLDSLKARRAGAGRAEGFDLAGADPGPGRVSPEGAWLTMHQMGNLKFLSKMTGYKGKELEELQKDLLSQIPVKATELQTRWLLPGAEFAGAEPPQKITTAWDAVRAVAYPSSMPAKYVAALLTGEDPMGRLTTGKPSILDETTAGQLGPVFWAMTKDHIGPLAHFIEDYMDVKNGKTDWLGNPPDIKGKYLGLRWNELNTEDKFRLASHELSHILGADEKGVRDWFKKKLDPDGTLKIGGAEDFKARQADDGDGDPDMQTKEEKAEEIDALLNAIKRDRLQDLLWDYYSNVRHLGTTVEKHHIIRVELYNLLEGNPGPDNKEKSIYPMTRDGNAAFIQYALTRIIYPMEKDLGEWDDYTRARTATDEQKAKALKKLREAVEEKTGKSVEELTTDDLGFVPGE